MLEGSVEGQKANYLFGYTLKEEPVPVGWVKTLRPCMECRSEYTFIDSEKVWHCMRCGWRSDEVNKKWKAGDVASVKEKYESGIKIRQIADDLGMGYQTVYMKVYQMKKAGEIVEPAPAMAVEDVVKKQDVHNSENMRIDDPHEDIEPEPVASEAVPPVQPTPVERLSMALVGADKLGMSVMSVCVNESSATLVFTLNLG